MKIKNISMRTFSHRVGKGRYSLEPNEIDDIPDEIAKIWLAYEDSIVTVDDGSKDKKIAELEQKLAMLEKGEPEPDNAEEEPKEISAGEYKEQLIAEAKSLHIQGVYNPNVSVETLEKKIAEAKETK